jgi:hypothetical protein
MNVTGDKRLIEDCGELEDAIATIQAAGLDPEHFDIDVHQMPPVADPRTGLFPIRYAVKVTNGMSGRGATLAGGNSEAWVERLEQKLEAGEFS